MNKLLLNFSSLVKTNKKKVTTGSSWPKSDLKWFVYTSNEYHSDCHLVLLKVHCCFTYYHIDGLNNLDDSNLVRLYACNIQQPLICLKGIFLCKFDQTQGTCEDINKITKQACKEGR